MEQRCFTLDETWSGGFYELAIELGPRSDDRLLAALRALWSFPDLEGVFIRHDLEPVQQESTPPLIEHVIAERHLYGIARLPHQAKTACATVMVREDEGTDWLDFYLPMGALSAHLDVGAFPFAEPGHDHSGWRMSLDLWLSNMGQFVFDHVQFALALIGHEVSGQTYAETLRVSGIPEKRWIGYLWPQQGKLQYFPCTEYAPPYSMR